MFELSNVLILVEFSAVFDDISAASADEGIFIYALSKTFDDGGHLNYIPARKQQ